MKKSLASFVSIAISLCLMTPMLGAAEKRALQVQDIMKFKSIRDARISDDGRWLAYEKRPDRGDGEGVVQPIADGRSMSVVGGRGPVFSKDSKWAAMKVEPLFAAKEKAKKPKDRPNPGMALIELGTERIVQMPDVSSFAFSQDSAWLAIQQFKEKESAGSKESGATGEGQGEGEGKAGKKDREVGSPLILRRLSGGRDTRIESVREYAFSQDSRFLAYSRATSDGRGNGLYYRNLSAADSERALHQVDNGAYGEIAWTKQGSRLAFLAAVNEGKGKPGPASILHWGGEGAVDEAVSDANTPEGWKIPLKNDLVWTRDGERLFFGLQPRRQSPGGDQGPDGSEEESNGADESATPPDPYDVDSLLKKRGLDVWHWDDPLINSHQKKIWDRVKDRTYRAVLHADKGEVVRLADKDLPTVGISQNPSYVLGQMDAPYSKEITWHGRFHDAYLIDLTSGERKRVAERLGSSSSLSPNGRFVAYFLDDHWHLYDAQSGRTRNLTESLDVPFYDEDHDYPVERSSYGRPFWIENDEALLIQDKYDLWSFSTKDGAPKCLTKGEGRRDERTLRIVPTDPEATFFKADERILLRSYHNLRKNFGFYFTKADRPHLEKALEEAKRFDFVAKARHADTMLFTRQDYGEFPDLWTADADFNGARRISQVNPQMDQFAWGESELVEWQSIDGIPLQGVLIKPGNYEPGKRYPVIVYFYRFFSQRLHEFNQMVVNHRPNFAFYASNGYALFLPDVRFEIGRPGFSAVKCIVPGVQKLVDMGIADAEAVGLHGHSWSGYQAAYMVTQTDIFAAAVAGAPVSNMTSAYGGIRWGTGLSRQFQYEKTQSRLGVSLWENRQPYIDNSPVFFADRINTPLLIQFGDEDGAVPWYQGIELYMACRRLAKDCVFLQYRGEPHHLQKYPNKLDYTLKMKEYFDHYLRGEPAAAWISEGVAYKGR